MTRRCRLLTQDAGIWFPAYGVARGKAGTVAVGGVFGADLERLGHAIEEFRFYVSGEVFVVEGTESGITREGVSWPEPKIAMPLMQRVSSSMDSHPRVQRMCRPRDFTSSLAERIPQLRP